MPITLGCPSCGKRFRARDESAGKKVKCPYCQAAVQVPSAEESAVAGAPTAPLPTPPGSSPGLPPPVTGRPMGAPAPGSRPLSPPAPVVATPADWGAGPASPPPPPQPEPPPPAPLPGRGAVREKDRAKPAPKPRPVPAAERTPEQLTAAAWRKARGGLFWVLFALFLLALPGFVGFAKAVYTRGGNELPKGEGWVKIEGYVNTDGPNAVRLTKMDEIHIAAYGLPVLIAGLALVFGRTTAGAAPRSSGARGLFAMSGLFTLFALAGLVTAAACRPLLFKEEERYATVAFLICGCLAEFWFLTGLVAAGLALKRPRAARAVGFLAFLVAVGAAVYMLGWDYYAQNWRPKQPDADILMYEQAALLLGWLLVVGVYWRAVASVRGAISEYLETVRET